MNGQSWHQLALNIWHSGNTSRHDSISIGTRARVHGRTFCCRRRMTSTIWLFGKLSEVATGSITPVFPLTRQRLRFDEIKGSELLSPFPNWHPQSLLHPPPLRIRRKFVRWNLIASRFQHPSSFSMILGERTTTKNEISPKKSPAYLTVTSSQVVCHLS